MKFDKEKMPKLGNLPLFWRIFATMVLVVLIFSLALSFAVTGMLRQQNYLMGITSIESDAKEIALYYNVSSIMGRIGIRFGTSSVITAMERVSAKNRAPVWLYDRLGNPGLGIIPGEEGTNALTQEEASALVRRVVENNETVFPNAFDRTLGTQSVTVGVPLVNADSTVAGAVIVNAQISDLQRGMPTFVSQLVAVAAAVLLLGLALAAFVARKVTHPMVEMAQTAHLLAQGEFTRRVPVRGDDEVGRLAKSFNEMADDLANLEEMRSAFVANVSHELRSPLTSIQGYVQGILDGTIPPEETLRYLAVVDEETQRLVTLVRDLLDLSRIESGSIALHFETFNINEMIRRAVIRVEKTMNEKQINAEILFRSDDLAVFADPARIEQVVYNLLDNAVKFSRIGGTVRVATHIAGEKAVIAVTDDGEGIAECDLPFVFERFYKADKSHSGGGTGLGLSIVRSILENHGEEIRASSTPNKGASFVFTLPLSK